MTRDGLIRRLRLIAREDGKFLELVRSRGKGSHIVVRLGGRTAVVPYSHGRDLRKGTLRSILQELGLDPRRFL